MKKKENLSFREIQLEETKMLKATIEFFEQNNLNYYISAGTLLGAVRHQGFIPWDDDIDIAMTRPEYNKLIKILKEHNLKISDNLEGSGFELGNSEMPFIKILNKNIRVEQSEQWEEYLWIDIFPLDGYPNNNESYYKKTKYLRKVFDLIRTDKNNIGLMTKNPIKRFIKRICIFCLKIWKYENFLKFYMKFCTKYDYDNCEYVHDNVFGDTPTLIDKKELETGEYIFEGLKVHGFKDYDTILTRLYGNYMELPPEEKRQNHSFKAWRIK